MENKVKEQIEKEVDFCVLKNTVTDIKEKVDKILDKLDSDYLTKIEYQKDCVLAERRLSFVEKVLGLVGTFLLIAFLSALVYGIINLPK